MQRINRKAYLDWLIRHKDKQLIKVVSGVRRCGKSTLFDIYREYLQQNGVEERQITFLNFEDVEYEELSDYRMLYDYIKARLLKDRMNYIFLDGIQHVGQFEKAVDSLFLKENCDVYITGSNAYFMSGELAFAITVDGKVAGSIGAFRQDNIHSQTAEMGYYVGENYWGKGVCTTAVKLACRYVFENTDIIRIFAEPFACNAASCRVLEKAGFQYEGTLRSNAVKNGKVLDMKMYSSVPVCLAHAANHNWKFRYLTITVDYSVSATNWRTAEKC